MGAFDELPRRVFLDSSALQAIQSFGTFIWENEPIPAWAKVRRHPHLLKNVEALRLIFQVNQRAGWQFAISSKTLDEVNAKGDRAYLRYAYDVLDHWRVCAEEDPSFGDTSFAARLDNKSVGYLGASDRELLKDAVRLGCDAFLTMEARLPKNASKVQALTGLRVLTPEQYWAILSPWAALWL